MNLYDSQRAGEEFARAIRSGNPQTIARSAAANIWPLYNDYFEWLVSTVVGLPIGVLEQFPLLRVLHPMPTMFGRASPLFVLAADADEQRSMSPEETDFVYLGQMMAHRISGDISAALALSRRLERRLLAADFESRDRVGGPLWYFQHQIGSTRLAAADTSGALLEFGTARQLAKFAVRSDAERLALGGIALAHAVRGMHRDAARALAEARSLNAPTLPHAASIASSEAAAAGLLAVDRMEEDLDDILDLMEPYDSTESSWSFSLLARCRACLACERPEDALEAIRLAADAHVTQPGSFAADVIASMSIQAHLMTGDLLWARRTADVISDAGVLTRLAMARLFIQDGRLGAAAQQLRILAADDRVGPAQRAESTLLSGWLELVRNGEVAHETAVQISRTTRRDDARRQIVGMPRQLLDQASSGLSREVAAEIERMRAGLTAVATEARPTLTPGELRILDVSPMHPSIASMASALGLSPNTVKSQLRKIYRSLGCSTRADATRIASRLRLLTPENGS